MHEYIHTYIQRDVTIYLVDRSVCAFRGALVAAVAPGPPSEGIQRTVSAAFQQTIKRGKTMLEKKSSWPFDFYQIGQFYPVDYHYWWHPHSTDCGNTYLTMMHAVAYSEEGEVFGADQVDHRKTMRAAHVLAMKAFTEATREDSSVAVRLGGKS